MSLFGTIAKHAKSLFGHVKRGANWLWNKISSSNHRNEPVQRVNLENFDADEHKRWQHEIQRINHRPPARDYEMEEKLERKRQRDGKI